MEYATALTPSITNERTVAFVGYSPPGCERVMFSSGHIKTISTKITQLLDDLYDDRRIAVPDKTIVSVLSSVSDAYVPAVGDMYSRYNIPTPRVRAFADIVDRTINIITSQVRNDLEIQKHNATLTKWTTILGDFNEQGLRSHPRIKIREKRPQPMLFNMNY